jgi:putative MATE family efflux protein
LSRLDLTTDSLNRSIVKLAAPALVDNVTASVAMLLIDMIFSRRLGTDGLAGVGVANVCFFVVMAVFMSIGAGAPALVAQATGAGNARQASRYGGQAVLLGVCIGLVFSAALIPFSESLITAIGTTGKAADIATAFLVYLYIALPFSFFVNIGAGVLRGYGDTATPMGVVGGMNILAAAAVALAVAPGDPMVAVRNAGLVMVGSRVAASGVMAVVLFTHLRGYTIRAADMFGWYRESVKRIVRLSLPVAGEQVLMRIGFLGFNWVVLALGTAAFAAHRIGVSVESLSFMPAFAFQIAATTLAGQAVGAGDYDLARQSTKKLAGIASIIAAVTGTGLWFIAKPVVVGLFEPEPEVARIATLCIRIAAFEQGAFALLNVYSGSLRGAGDTVSPMLVTLIGSVFIRVPLAYVVGIRLRLGLPGIWGAAVLEWWTRTGVVYLLYRLGRWLRLKPHVDIEEALMEAEEGTLATVEE